MNEKLGSAPIGEQGIEMPSLRASEICKRLSGKYYQNRKKKIKDLIDKDPHEDQQVKVTHAHMMYDMIEDTQNKLNGVTVSFHCECTKCDDKTPNDIFLSSFLRSPHLYFRQACGCGGTAYSEIDVDKFDKLMDELEVVDE